MKCCTSSDRVERGGRRLVPPGSKLTTPGSMVSVASLPGSTMISSVALRTYEPFGSASIACSLIHIG